jgi:hypothetical protein
MRMHLSKKICMEKWIEIEGFSNYLVSDFGNIMNKNTGKLLAANVKNNGYKRVSLCRPGRVYEVNVHRLVAKAFISNPQNKKTVNHKNGIRTDNRVENLEWATMSEQMKHSIHRLGSKCGGIKNLKNDPCFESKRLAGLKNADRSKQREIARDLFTNRNPKARNVINKITGERFSKAKDALKASGLKISHSMFSMMLNNKRKNKTDFLYV